MKINIFWCSIVAIVATVTGATDTSVGSSDCNDNDTCTYEMCNFNHSRDANPNCTCLCNIKPSCNGGNTLSNNTAYAYPGQACKESANRTTWVNL